MLSIRMTEEEKKALQHDAHQHDMNVSTYLRWLIKKERKVNEKG